MYSYPLPGPLDAASAGQEIAGYLLGSTTPQTKSTATAAWVLVGFGISYLPEGEALLQQQEVPENWKEELRCYCEKLAQAQTSEQQQALNLPWQTIGLYALKLLLELQSKN